jgi:hypothetical protein
VEGVRFILLIARVAVQIFNATSIGIEIQIVCLSGSSKWSGFPFKHYSFKHYSDNGFLLFYLFRRDGLKRVQVKYYKNLSKNPPFFVGHANIYSG